MNEIALSSQQRLQSLAAVMACVAAYGVMVGMAVPLLSLILEERGIGRTVIGLNSAMPSLAMLMASPFMPRLVARIGLRPFIFSCIVVELATFLTLPILDDLYAWFALRFLMGASGAGLFVAAEAWINEVAQEKTRGRVMGIYGMMVSASFAVGPLILPATGIAGWTPFLIGAGFVAVSALPLLWSGPQTPRFDGTPSINIVSFVRLAPTLSAAVLTYAFVEFAVLSLLPVYGVRSGFGIGAAAVMLSVIAVGTIFLQYPIGWAADALSRRRVLAVCGLAGAAGALALPFAAPYPWLLWPLLFLWGGLFAGLYPVAMAMLGDRFRGADLMTANAAFGVLWGIGGLTGPSLAGAAMDIWDPEGLPIVLFAAFVAFSLVLLYRSLTDRS